MYKRVSPVAAAKRVLHAFPFPKAGAEISQSHIEDYFRRRGIALTEFLMGLRYATQVGWIRATDLQSFILLEAGMDELVGPVQVPAASVSVWHSWAHP